MNERIQNLKDKIWADEYWTKPNTDKLLPAQLNRFAELIVAEMLQTCEDHPGWSGRMIGEQIKQDFGVEE